MLKFVILVFREAFHSQLWIKEALMQCMLGISSTRNIKMDIFSRQVKEQIPKIEKMKKCLNTYRVCLLRTAREENK